VLKRNIIPSGKPGNRSANRLKLAMNASLELPQGSRLCFIDNLSSVGARLWIKFPIDLGETGILHFAERSAHCSVVWQSEDHCGLEFDPPLPLEEMQRLLWITQNREQYDRESLERAEQQWSGKLAPLAEPRPEPVEAAPALETELPDMGPRHKIPDICNFLTPPKARTKRA